MASTRENAILEVIVYFDLFSDQLTILEIAQSGEGEPLAEIILTLRTSAWLRARLESRNGMWFLSGRDLCIAERQKRYRASKPKIDRARRFAHLARFIPWVQQVYACNSLGLLHAKPESDIDLFIVAQRGHIWSARFFCVMIAKLFFSRPTLAHATDGICLSFFASQGAHLSKLALPGGDVYYAHWLKQLLPLIPHPALSRRERGWGEGIESVMERLLRWMQLKMLPTHLKAMANRGTNVVISDEFLKFHDHDKREYFRKEFQKRLAEVCA